jgi:hypothetical protein
MTTAAHSAVQPADVLDLHPVLDAYDACGEGCYGMDTQSACRHVAGQVCKVVMSVSSSNPSNPRHWIYCRAMQCHDAYLANTAYLLSCCLLIHRVLVATVQPCFSNADLTRGRLLTINLSIC